MVARKLILIFGQIKQAAADVDAPAGRELEVLKLIAHGWSNGEIARELTVNEGTVRVHVSNILSKLHLENRTSRTLRAA